jgi:hypothetical protein
VWLCVVGLGTPSGAAAAATPDDRSAQSLRIDVRGAIAEVRVHRKLTTCDGVPWSSIRGTSGARTRSAGECILDLALPAGAALLRVDLAGAGTGARAIGAAGGGGKATDTAEQRYVEAARATGHEPAAAAFDEEVRFRLRIVDTRPKPGTPGTAAERLPPTELDFTYAAPLSLEGNLAHLDFPAAPELSPPETAVEIRADLGVPVARLSIAGENSLRQPMAPGSGAFVVRSAGRVSTRSAWRVTFTLSAPRGPRVPLPPILALASVGPRSVRGGKARLALALGRPGIEAAPIAAVGLPAPDRSGTSPDLSERVLFVIDRSRSVGYGGLEAERDFALELLRNLPPSTRFDAVFFDRTPRRLFPVARQATRQALGALGEALVPENLANGTELVPAIRFASELLEREAAEFGPRTLLVVLTDGAVGAAAGGRDPWTVATEGAGSTTRPPQVRLRLPDLLVAVVSIRPNDDPSTSPDERRRLQELAAVASSGGIEAAFHVGDLTQGLGDVLNGLQAGGAVFDVGLASSPTSAARSPVAHQIVPGGGVALLTELPGGGSGARISLLQRGRRSSLPLHPTPVAAAVLEALSSQGASPGPSQGPEPGRFLVGPGFVALWEPVRQSGERAASAAGPGGSGQGQGRGSGSARATPPESAGPQGFMERSVVRDSLSLAYTPRARACYLTRSARTPEDRDLSGRVRIAIDLLRGEVGAARILSSTLARPAIEHCLRESAFALDVPRAYRNDDPVTAVLNLVFRPRTSDHRPLVDRSAFDRELELVIEAAALAPIPEGPSDAGIPAPADAQNVGTAGAATTAFPRPDGRPRVDLPDK